MNEVWNWNTCVGKRRGNRKIAVFWAGPCIFGRVKASFSSLSSYHTVFYQYWCILLQHNSTGIETSSLNHDAVNNTLDQAEQEHSRSSALGVQVATPTTT